MKDSNNLAKTQVCAMLRAGDIRRNVLLKFITYIYVWRRHVCVPPRGTNMTAGR